MRERPAGAGIAATATPAAIATAIQIHRDNAALVEITAAVAENHLSGDEFRIVAG